MVISSTTAATLGVLGVLVVGGGTVAVAQQSEPGDLLYPLNITASSEVDTGVEADLKALQETYDEAASLEAQGSLTADVSADLADRYFLHLSNVQEALAEMEAEGDLDGAAALRAELRTTLRQVGSFFDEEDDSSSAASSEESSVNAPSSASTDTSVKVDANASAGVNVSADGDEDVRIESRDSDSEHYESEDGSVKVDANAEATSTVNINQN